jgi:hypothetical protein
MAKTTPKERMLLLGCAALVLCAASLFAGTDFLYLYYKSLKSLPSASVPVSSVLRLECDFMGIFFGNLLFYSYVAWAAFRTRKYLKDKA